MKTELSEILLWNEEYVLCWKGMGQGIKVQRSGLRASQKTTCWVKDSCKTTSVVAVPDCSFDSVPCLSDVL